ncbi:hypothetical protein THOE12_50015 [Vibrio rotiferianus]|nr:hypothetical protein THOE12_50015 [Vibrio rotiferianus]
MIISSYMQVIKIVTEQMQCRHESHEGSAREEIPLEELLSLS